MLFISGLDFVILTSLFPTIILEKNFIQEYHVHLISFYISFLVSFNGIIDIIKLHNIKIIIIIIIIINITYLLINFELII